MELFREKLRETSVNAKSQLAVWMSWTVAIQRVERAGERDREKERETGEMTEWSAKKATHQSLCWRAQTERLSASVSMALCAREIWLIIITGVSLYLRPL